MDPSCLQYALTDAEREAFNRDGFLVVEDAMPDDLRESLIETIDDLYERGVLEGGRTDKTITRRINKLGFIHLDRSFFDMVAHERLLPKVWGILGWNVYLYHSHLAVTGKEPGTYEPHARAWGWHQDSGQMNRDMETSPRPRISLKVGYFLTDVSNEGMGNFWVVPGSQLSNTLPQPEEGAVQPEGAIPVKVKAGSAVIFDRRIWHAATPNFSDVTRRVLFYGYGYRWIRTRDDMEFPRDWYDDSHPILKQMMGHSTNEHGRSSPSDADVPLKVWLEEHEQVQREKALVG